MTMNFNVQGISNFTKAQNTNAEKQNEEHGMGLILTDQDKAFIDKLINKKDKKVDNKNNKLPFDIDTEMLEKFKPQMVKYYNEDGSYQVVTSPSKNMCGGEVTVDYYDKNGCKIKSEKYTVGTNPDLPTTYNGQGKTPVAVPVMIDANKGGISFDA